MIRAGMMMFQGSVKPKSWVSHAGKIRSAPSSQPTYQSGCEPAEISAGSYGPYSQTGLMGTNAASSVVTPKTMKKKPPALAV